MTTSITYTRQIYLGDYRTAVVTFKDQDLVVSVFNSIGLQSVQTILLPCELMGATDSVLIEKINDKLKLKGENTDGSFPHDNRMMDGQDILKRELN